MISTRTIVLVGAVLVIAACTTGASENFEKLDTGNGLTPQVLVLFQTGNDVRAVRSDGSVDTLLRSPRRWAVSSDGSKIAWEEPSDAEQKVYVRSLSKDAPRHVVAGVSLERWVGSGKYLWARSARERGGQLIRFDGDSPVGAVTVSGWISVTSRDELIYADCPGGPGDCTPKVTDLESGEQRTLSGSIRRWGPCHASGGACWSEDGGTATFVDNHNRYALHVLSADSGVSSPIAFGVEDYYAVPSPDGRKVAFLKSNGDPLFPNYALWVADRATARSFAITREGQVSAPPPPVWSDDSQRIYFRLRGFATFSVLADGSHGHRIGDDEVAFCATSSLALEMLGRPGGTSSRPLAVAIDRETHAGVGQLAAAVPQLSDRAPPAMPLCAISADSRFALEWQGKGLRLYDLTTGARIALAQGTIESAAWAGRCARDSCPAASLAPASTPMPTPYSGELPPGVVGVPPFVITLPSERGLYTSPSEGQRTVPRGPTILTVIGRLETDEQVWYYIAEDPSLGPDARYVQARDIGLDQPSPGPPVQGVVEVSEGMTLESIAAEYGVTVEEILAVNPELSPDGLQPGEEIVIPDPIWAPREGD